MSLFFQLVKHLVYKFIEKKLVAVDENSNVSEKVVPNSLVSA